MANQTVTGTVDLTAVASDNVAVSRVDFYVNNVLQGSDSAAPYSHNWDTAALARGSYTLSARAYDASGNMRQSAAVAVTVPIWVSMNTAVTGTTAVGTVYVHGIAVPDPYGLDVLISMPAGASISSVVASGPYAAAGLPSLRNPTLVAFPSSEMGSGEIMKLNFADVPPVAVPGDFGVSLSAVFDFTGNQIQ